MSKITQTLSALMIVLLVSSLAPVVYSATPIYQLSDVKSTFLQVPLTHDIYRYSQQANLQDVVVLDAEQNALPYRLVAIEQKQEALESHNVLDSLNFYPVTADAAPDTLRKLHTRQVKVQGDKVQVSTTDKTLNEQTPEFYLIDISKLNHDINSLSIDWVVNANNQYLEVELEATRNLQDWFSIAKSTLVNIYQQEQSLKRNRIDINISKNEYEFLRIKVLRGADNLQITNVTAEQTIGVNPREEKRSDSWSLGGQVAKVQTTVYLPNAHSKTYSVAAWEFVRNETTPIDSLAIDVGANIYGDDAKIFSRSAENQNWQLQYQSIWFNTQVGAEWQKSNAINVNSNTDKYWRIELNESAKAKIDPKLVLSWSPIQLQIIASNKPPFVIAINRDKNINHAQVFNQLLLGTSPVWVSAQLNSLGVEPATINASHQTTDWKQWLFWGALLLAVAVLLLFSLKLFKQLNLTKMS